MNIARRKNSKGDKEYFTIELGRGKGQRITTGVFVYTEPKGQTQKNHNKEALLILELKKSQILLEQQSIGTGYIPAHKFKANFLDYFQDFVNSNRRLGKRHLANSFTQFKLFVRKPVISPIDITEPFCMRFRQFLLDKYSGDTPANYFCEFKKVIKAATKEGYWRNNPAEDVKSRTNASKHLKENLEADEYRMLIQTPCANELVKLGFLFSCYTGLRYCDTQWLSWDKIKDHQLTTRIIQRKTGKPVVLSLHPIARAILGKIRKLSGEKADGKVFALPSYNGSNKILQEWIEAAKIQKHITWSCARLSFSILLQDNNVNTATVAYLMGHTTTHQVEKVYKRHRPLDQTASIATLPAPGEMPYFLEN